MEWPQTYFFGFSGGATPKKLSKMVKNGQKWPFLTVFIWPQQILHVMPFFWSDHIFYIFPTPVAQFPLLIGQRWTRDILAIYQLLRCFLNLAAARTQIFMRSRPMTEGSHNIIKTRTIHKKEPYPFGLEYGLMTDLGIISCNKGD